VKFSPCGEIVESSPRMPGRNRPSGRGRPRGRRVMLANASIQVATMLQGLPLAPLSTASCLRLTSTLRRARLVPRFRGDDTCRLVGRVSARARMSTRASDTARTDKERTPCVDWLILLRGLSGTTSDWGAGACYSFLSLQIRRLRNVFRCLVTRASRHDFGC
jgi:hypothetical protein